MARWLTQIDISGEFKKYRDSLINIKQVAMATALALRTVRWPEPYETKKTELMLKLLEIEDSEQYDVLLEALYDLGDINLGHNKLCWIQTFENVVTKNQLPKYSLNCKGVKAAIKRFDLENSRMPLELWTAWLVKHVRTCKTCADAGKVEMDLKKKNTEGAEVIPLPKLKRRIDKSLH